MWFKAASVFQLESAFKYKPEELHDNLTSKPFSPCNRRQLDSRGWVPPMGDESDQLVHASSGFMLLKLRTEERILPSSVISEHMLERVKSLEQKLDRKIRGKEKLEIRDNVVMELTAQAFTRSNYEQVLLMPAQDMLIVDTSSAKKVDACTSFLRDSLGGLHIKPMQTAVDPAKLFTRWLKGTRKPPADLAVGDECVLQDEDNISGTVRCNKQDLASDEIRALPATGKQVIKIALEASESISFVLDQEFVFSKIKFLDTEETDTVEDANLDAAAAFDANMTLMAGQLSRLIPRMVEVLGGAAESDD